MGFDCQLCILRQVEDFYILEPIETIFFPTTHLSIKDNDIEKLMNCMEKAKVKHLASRLQSNVYSLLFTFIELVSVFEEGY